jgi:hypothetical protein
MDRDRSIKRFNFFFISKDSFLLLGHDALGEINPTHTYVLKKHRSNFPT